MNWLVASIIASVVLTVLLNVVIRLFPTSTSRAADRDVARSTESNPSSVRSNVTVWFPWKAMLVVSVVGTILLNLLL